VKTLVAHRRRDRPSALSGSRQARVEDGPTTVGTAAIRVRCLHRRSGLCRGHPAGGGRLFPRDERMRGRVPSGRVRAARPFVRHRPPRRFRGPRSR
jgi:hypothetical protein